MRSIRQLPPHVIALANLAGKAGKKAMVVSAVANTIDTADMAVRVALDGISRAESWSQARPYIDRLCYAGIVLESPEKVGLNLPRKACSFPHWGLPNVREVAKRLLA